MTTSVIDILQNVAIALLTLSVFFLAWCVRQHTLQIREMCRTQECTTRVLGNTYESIGKIINQVKEGTPYH